MFGKAFIIFLSFIVLIEGGGLCPTSPATGPGVECKIVPGCNYVENGTLTPTATQCENELPDADCDVLFPCNTGTGVSGATPPIVDCNPKATNTDQTSDKTKYPFVRSLNCNTASPSIALKCAKTCGMCCLTSAFSCDDATRPPISCSGNTDKCQDPNWTNIMSQYCPKTCGLCQNGTCSDVNSGCNTMTALCKDVDWQSYMITNCARTCGYCTTTPSATPTTPACTNIASNCAQNANLCTNATYRTLMLQQCCATCSGTSASCVDTNPSCTNWVSNGFCSSTFYTTAQKQQYCGRSCNLC